MSSLTGKAAQDLFPDLISKPRRDKTNFLTPPPPPDIDKLVKGMQVNDPNKQNDLPFALLFIASEQERTLAEKILEEIGYKVDTALSATHAIQKLQEVEYKLIICNAESVAEGIHKHICRLPPAKRRVIFYVLVGPHLHTLYDLEALTLSANLVINNKELRYLKQVLAKGFREHENLFGLFLSIINDSNSLL